MGKRFQELSQKGKNKSLFCPKLAVWAKNSLFWCFWPNSRNLWPKCYIPLESVIFFWIFETKKIEKNQKKNFFYIMVHPNFKQFEGLLILDSESWNFLWHLPRHIYMIYIHLSGEIQKTIFLSHPNEAGCNSNVFHIVWKFQFYMVYISRRLLLCVSEVAINMRSVLYET